MSGNQNIVEQVECWFGKRGSADRYTKIYTVYNMNNVNYDFPMPDGFPVFYFKNEMLGTAGVLSGLKAGNWIETADNYICPVIRAHTLNFRIPGGGSYEVFHVANRGLGIYFAPPRGLKSQVIRQAKIESTVLSPQQRTFCWHMAQYDDPVRACLEAYDFKKHRINKYGGKNEKAHANEVSKKLMELPKIRKGIMSAIEQHMLALNMNAEDLVLRKHEKLMSELLELTTVVKDSLIKKMTDGTPLFPNDIEMLTSVVDRISEGIDKGAEWLEYNNDGSGSGEIGTESSSFVFGQLVKTNQLADQHAEHAQQIENYKNGGLIETAHKNESEE